MSKIFLCLFSLIFYLFGCSMSLIWWVWVKLLKNKWFWHKMDLIKKNVGLWVCFRFLVISGALEIGLGWIFEDRKIIKSSTTFMLKPKPSSISKSIKFYKKSEIVFLPKSDLCALTWPYLELQMSKSGFLNGSGKVRDRPTTFMKNTMMNSTV